MCALFFSIVKKEDRELIYSGLKVKVLVVTVEPAMDVGMEQDGDDRSFASYRKLSLVCSNYQVHMFYGNNVISWPDIINYSVESMALDNIEKQRNWFIHVQQ